MIEINLLPKELQHKGFGFKPDKKLINVVIGGVAIAAVLLLFSYFFQIRKLNSIESEITQFQAQKAALAAEIEKVEEIEQKKAQILARRSAILILNKNREYWVTLLEDLVRRVPEYVWLSNVDQAPAVAAAQPATAQGQAQQPPPPAPKSTIEGYSFSLNALATFLVRLKKSELFNNIEISEIKLQETDKAKAYSFALTCNLAATKLEVSTTESAQASGVAGTQF
jgi:Tfp pilus assembly protein PilN